MNRKQTDHTGRAIWGQGSWFHMSLGAWMFIRVLLCCALSCGGRGLASD